MGVLQFILTFNKNKKLETGNRKRVNVACILKHINLELCVRCRAEGFTVQASISQRER